MNKKVAALTVAVLASVGLIALAPAAFATSECEITTANDSAQWSTLGADDVTQTAATATIEADGVRLVTTGTADKVSAYFPISVKLKDITEFKFTNTNTLGLPPSGQLVWDPDNDASTWNGTLVWETSYQAGTPASPFDMYEGGNAKWWLTKTTGDLTSQTSYSMTEILAKYPEAGVLAYGLNVGSGGQATSNLVNNLVIKAGSTCQKHRWALVTPTTPTSPTQGGENPTASPTAVPTTTSPEATKSPTGGPTSVPPSSRPSDDTVVPSSTLAIVPLGNDETSLPVTGSHGLPIVFLLGIACLIVGAGLVTLLAIRRKNEQAGQHWA